VVPPTAPTAPITPSKPQSKPQSRGPARYSMPTSSSASRRSAVTPVAARPSSRASLATNASPRRPGLASHASNPARLSHAGSPALSLNRGASYASPRGSPNSKIPRPATPSHGSRHGGSAGGGVMSQPTALESPAAKEAKRWAALKKKEEREADESIRRLDAQLKAMIREGKEALGTRIEVEIEDDPPFRRGAGGHKKWAF